MALLSMAVEDLGQPAVSFTGSQAGIVTDTDHGKAKIIEVRGDRIRAAVAEGKVAIVAGFQGVSTALDITTLGRGGSDTTAVALAAALGADACEIYTDVEGVYTADPRIVPTARKLARVSFDEMLEMAATGGRVLALRSVEFARNHGVKVHVRSSFTWAPGTWITEEDAEMDAVEAMEQAIISGVTHDTGEAKVTIERVPDRPGIAATIFRDLAEAGINVDMIVQNVSSAGHTDISFTVPRPDVDRTARCMEKIVVDTEAIGFATDEHIGRVSLVGAGMKTHPGIAARMFETLANEGVNIEMISTSTIRISCVLAEDDVERAVRSLHAAFGLDKE
jgi:aspartate kinase